MLFAGAFSARKAGAMGAAEPVFTGASTHVLGTGKVPILPPGNDFVSVIELGQAAGATLGPHAGHTGFAYGLRGQEIIALAGGPTLRIEAGQAGFIGGVVQTFPIVSRPRAAWLRPRIMTLERGPGNERRPAFRGGAYEVRALGHVGAEAIR